MNGKVTFVVLIATTALSAAGAFLGALPAALAITMAPNGFEGNSVLIARFLSVFTFPVVCLAAIGASWLLYAKKRFITACSLALLPLVNVIVYSALSERYTRYENVDGEWCFVTRDGRGRHVDKLGADNDTFEVILSDAERRHFAKDKNRVWMRSDVIRGADPVTFGLLKGPYSKDKLRAYCGNVPMQVANLDAFEVVSFTEMGHEIPNHAHFVQTYGDAFKDFEVSDINPAIFSDGWARDGVFYYYGPGRVEGADYATFRIVDSSSARDKNQEFLGVFSRTEWEKRRDRKKGND